MKAKKCWSLKFSYFSFSKVHGSVNFESESLKKMNFFLCSAQVYLTRQRPYHCLTGWVIFFSIRFLTWSTSDHTTVSQTGFLFHFFSNTFSTLNVSDHQCGQLGLQNANWATQKSVWLLKKQCWLLPKNCTTLYQAPKNWATFHRVLQFERMLSDACEGCQNKIHIFKICQNWKNY